MTTLAIVLLLAVAIVVCGVFGTIALLDYILWPAQDNEP